MTKEQRMQQRLAENRRKSEEEDNEMIQGDDGLLQSDLDVDAFDELNEKLESYEQQQTENQVQ